MTESASTDFSALRSKFSSEFSAPSYSSPLSTTMKRSPSVSSSPASSYKSYTNAIAEYTATVERLRSRRNSMQDASNARRDSSLRASSSTGLPSSSAIASRRPSYVSSYVAPSTVARSSDYIAKTASRYLFYTFLIRNSSILPEHFSMKSYSLAASFYKKDHSC
jgi:hypothetical protein